MAACRELLLLLLAAGCNAQRQPVLCPVVEGAIVGLASDNVHHVRLPSDAPPQGTNPESWVVVTEGTTAGGPINSFTGSFAQVLPDDRDSYSSIYGVGSFTMTGLDWAFEVETPGLHSLFLRWTGGDSYGGGDSLYAVIRRAGSDELVSGPDTLRPRTIPFGENPGQFVGGCYHHQTHQIPCFTPEMDNSTCAGTWMDASRMARMHRDCADPMHLMETVVAPQWYLFSGQSEALGPHGTSMDFSRQPWDVSCEAGATGTADSGGDFARWELPVGRYHLVLYPREDGTAVDAFYLAGPNVNPPTSETIFTAGGSSIACTGGARNTAVAGSGSDLTHGSQDASGWGSRGNRTSGRGPWGGPVDQHAIAMGCGRCLVPLNPGVTDADGHTDVCPSAEVLNAMATCDGNLEIGELCEADGECGTNVRINNCDNDTPDPGAQGSQDGGGGGPRRQRNRNNDVYKRVACDTAPPGSSAALPLISPSPPAPSPAPSPPPAMVVIASLTAAGALAAFTPAVIDEIRFELTRQITGLQPSQVHIHANVDGDAVALEISVRTLPAENDAVLERMKVLFADSDTATATLQGVTAIRIEVLTVRAAPTLLVAATISPPLPSSPPLPPTSPLTAVSDGGGGAVVVIAIVVLLLLLLALIVLAYVRYSRRHAGGITVAPWKLFGRARTETINVTMPTGSLSAQSATPYVAPLPTVIGGQVA